MNNKDLEKIKEQAKQSAKKIFAPKDKKIEEELKKETVMGNPKNLAKPDNKSE